MNFTTKSLLILFISLLSFGVARAQEEQQIDIDLNSIEVNVTMNPEHYREMLQLFVAGDTTMRLDQVATAYYGHAFTVDYDPLADYSEIEKMFDEDRYDEAFDAAMAALETDPLSLQLTIIAAVASTRSRTSSNVRSLPNLQNRFTLLTSVMLCSGSGITPDSPFYVIREADILAILNKVLGVDRIVGKSGLGNLDAYKVKFEGSDREHILYFNNTLQHRYEQQLKN